MVAGVAVRVRLFAALREAAGVAEVEVEPAPLVAVLDGLQERYGALFSKRLDQASVLVDGQRRRRDEPSPVPDGAEIALLPPFSGGAHPAPLTGPGTALPRVSSGPAAPSPALGARESSEDAR